MFPPSSSVSTPRSTLTSLSPLPSVAVAPVVFAAARPLLLSPVVMTRLRRRTRSKSELMICDDGHGYLCSCLTEPFPSPYRNLLLSVVGSFKNNDFDSLFDLVSSCQKAQYTNFFRVPFISLHISVYFVTTRQDCLQELIFAF